MNNNQAIVVTINKLEEIPGMDNIQLAKLFGTQVIVSKDVKPGDTMIYVDSNMKLSPEFLYSNNLYRHAHFNKESSKAGFFDDNGRVKTIKMKGIISDGFLFPPEFLSYIDGIDFNDLTPGLGLTEVNGVSFCEKYIPPQKVKGQPNKEKKKTLEIPMFATHFETGQFMRNTHKIPAKSIVYLEEKVHGTSHRTGNVLVNINSVRGWFKHLMMSLAGIKDSFSYMYINGTRRVVHNPFRKKQTYHDNTMREEVLDKVRGNLLKGEQIYLELFGHEKTGKAIQKDFTYGTPFLGEKTYRSMLYRVTMNNEDGDIVDYPREYVYNRAEELGFEPPHLFEKVYYSGTQRSLEILQEKIIAYAQGQSALDNNTLREGVVVWFINTSGKWEALKYKSDAFRLQESKAKDKGFVDVEDIQ